MTAEYDSAIARVRRWLWGLFNEKKARVAETPDEDPRGK